MVLSAGLHAGGEYMFICADEVVPGVLGSEVPPEGVLLWAVLDKEVRK